MDSALAVTLKTLAGEPLSLGDAVRTALEGGSTIARRAAAELAAARGALRREHGAFDPELFADILRSDRDTPNAFIFAGGNLLREERTTGIGGLRMLLPFGTELEGTISGTRQSTTSFAYLLDPLYGAETSLNIRQPLLRGFGPGTSSESKATKREEE